LDRFGLEEFFKFEYFDEGPALFESDGICRGDIVCVYLIWSAFAEFVAHNNFK